MGKEVKTSDFTPQEIMSVREHLKGLKETPPKDLLSVSSKLSLNLLITYMRDACSDPRVVHLSTRCSLMSTSAVPPSQVLLFALLSLQELAQKGAAL